MQLNRIGRVRSSLALCTAALLGSQVTHAKEGDVIESSLLVYSETDRVTAVEGIAGFRHYLNGGRILSGKFTYDGLTGASPSGATPSREIQTFTRPSGEGSYQTPAGEIPLDDSFLDTRLAGDLSLLQPLDRLTNLTLGIRGSQEHDYLSLGVDATLSRDLNDRNTTLLFGGSIALDRINPEGGVPHPLAVMQTGTEESEDEHERESDADSKTVLDGLIGVTQIFDRKTIGSVNFAVGYSSGYHSDPYKILTLVGDLSDAKPGEPLEYRFERRPSTRVRQSVHTSLRRFLGSGKGSGAVLTGEYRFYWDDWGLNSHTLDLYYRQPLGKGHAVQPHLRWYSQSEADFYRRWLVENQPLPEFASADVRLARMTAKTVGLTYFLPEIGKVHLSIAGEFYVQDGEHYPGDAFGSLKEFDLFPKLEVVMFRTGFSYDI
jgi:hypothetical protein